MHHMHQCTVAVCWVFLAEVGLGEHEMLHADQDQP